MKANVWLAVVIVTLLALAWATRYAEIRGYDGCLYNRWTGRACHFTGSGIEPFLPREWWFKKWFEKKAEVKGKADSKKVYVYKLDNDTLRVPEEDLAEFFDKVVEDGCGARLRRVK